MWVRHPGLVEGYFMSERLSKNGRRNLGGHPIRPARSQGRCSRGNDCSRPCCRRGLRGVFRRRLRGAKTPGMWGIGGAAIAQGRGRRGLSEEILDNGKRLPDDYGRSQAGKTLVILIAAKDLCGIARPHEIPRCAQDDRRPAIIFSTTSSVPLAPPPLRATTCARFGWLVARRRWRPRALRRRQREVGPPPAWRRSGLAQQE
jgi:hypothetical protein